MEELVVLSQNPSLILLITFFALVFLLIGFVIFHLLSKIRFLLQRSNSISSNLSNVNDGFVRLNLSLEAIDEKLERLNVQQTSLLSETERIKTELGHLSTLVGGDNRMTRAIDLARGGSTAEEISINTGISGDEAEALVKFHGPSKRI